VLAGFIRRDLCVDFQIASSFIAAPPINPPTSAGPFAFNILHTISGVNRLPNCCESAISADASEGKRASERPTAIAPPTTIGTVDMVFW